MITWRGHSYWFTEDHRAVIGYRVVSGVAITTGGPVGDPARRAEAIRGFAEHCHASGWTPCLYSVGAELLPTIHDMGWRHLQVAEEMVLPLADLRFTGKAWQDVRSALNRARKLGVRAEWCQFRSAPAAVVPQIRAISDEWVARRGLPELGFLSDDQDKFERLLRSPDGILLVTGPTGSGKTSTLYACLNYINKPDRKIITVEEPVEYQMTGINQVQVNNDAGMTFPIALRSILRQAPNIIMIGEIRDLETASIATNASLTGHLVFSTLHTNDAPSAVARLVDIGVQPFLVASSVRAIMAQRLVRRLCTHCKHPADLSETEMRALRIEPSQMKDSQVMKAPGCDHCRHTGYRGRMGIFEIFIIDDDVRHMINKRTSTFLLRQRARELSMRTLREDGVRKVLSGLTSADEVISVTIADAN